MPDIKGLLADPRFGALQPAQQRQVLGGIDARFSSLTDEQFGQFMKGVQNPATDGGGLAPGHGAPAVPYHVPTVGEIDPYVQPERSERYAAKYPRLAKLGAVADRLPSAETVASFGVPTEEGAALPYLARLGKSALKGVGKLGEEIDILHPLSPRPFLKAAGEAVKSFREPSETLPGVERAAASPLNRTGQGIDVFEPPPAIHRPAVDEALERLKRSVEGPKPKKLKNVPKYGGRHDPFKDFSTGGSRPAPRASLSLMAKARAAAGKVGSETAATPESEAASAPARAARAGETDTGQGPGLTKDEAAHRAVWSKIHEAADDKLATYGRTKGITRPEQVDSLTDAEIMEYRKHLRQGTSKGSRSVEQAREGWKRAISRLR